MENNEKKQISLDIKPEIGKGSYSNLAIITHSKYEFIVDFATMLPGLRNPEVTNRIVMNPVNAKRLMNALIDNVLKYENQFGKIILEEEQDQPEKGTINLSDFLNNSGKQS